MQGAIYFKILIWGPSYSWLEWTKKPAGYKLPSSKNVLHYFSAEKKIYALLVCEEKISCP